MNVSSAPPAAASSGPASSSSSSSDTGAPADGSFAALIGAGTAPTAEGRPTPAASARPGAGTARATPAATDAVPGQPADAEALALEAATPQLPLPTATELQDSLDDDTAALPDWPPPGLASLLGLAPPTTRDPASAPVPQGDLPAARGGGTAQPPVSPFLPAAAAPGASAAAATATAPLASDAVTQVADQGAAALALDAGLQAAVDGPEAPAFVVIGSTPAPAPAAAGAPATLPASLPQPDLHGEAFADDVGANLSWMADQKIGHAHIRISPQDMGPIEVRLNLDGDRISADFTAAAPDVRQALEQGLPRLRDMLGQQGFQLAHAGVGQQHDGGRGQDAEGTARGRGNDGNGLGGVEGGDDAPLLTAGQLRLRGLLDAYA